jgi:hypothetical protein
MKTHIEKPETQAEVRYCSQLLVTKVTVCTVSIQESCISIMGRLLCHPPCIYLPLLSAAGFDEKNGTPGV